MPGRFRSLADDRGAMLVHVVWSLMAIMAFLAFTIDYGVLWASRRQAQNSADAAALAGAISLAYDNYTDRTDTGPAKQTAYASSQSNLIWAQSPNVVVATDITFPPCPDDGTDGCIRVDVYRTNARGNALPTFIGSLFGMNSQDIQATATAKVSIGNAMDCLKPWAVIDKWEEHWENGAPSSTPWSLSSDYDKYIQQGPNAGDPDPAITPPDYYEAPTQTTFGTGFHPFDANNNYTSDYGMQMTLKMGSQNDFTYATGWFAALQLDPNCPGGACYGAAIKGCVGITYKIGDPLTFDTQPGQLVGPTGQSTETDSDSLINLDPYAVWDQSLNGGWGGIKNSAYAVSPRIVHIPLVDPDEITEAQKGGKTWVPISNIAGFFIEDWDSGCKCITGRLMTAGGTFSSGGSPIGPGSAFLKIVQLIR